MNCWHNYFTAKASHRAVKKVLPLNVSTMFDLIKIHT